MKWNFKIVVIIVGATIGVLVILLVVLSVISAIGGMFGPDSANTADTKKVGTKPGIFENGSDSSISTGNSKRNLARKGSIVGNMTKEGASASVPTAKTSKDPLAFLEQGTSRGVSGRNTDVVSCRIKLLNASDSDIELSLSSDSSSGKVTQMQVWTDNIKTTRWVNYKTLYNTSINEDDETVYVKFKDSKGNISAVCSEEL